MSTVISSSSIQMHSILFGIKTSNMIRLIYETSSNGKSRMGRIYMNIYLLSIYTMKLHY